MKELVLFYSYTGNTKKAAEKFAKEKGFDVCEATDKKRPKKFFAYTAGIVKVIKNGIYEINPLKVNGEAVNFEDYGVVNVFAPVWAGHAAPSANAALRLLPKGTKIKLFMVSASQKSDKESQSKRITDLGLEIIGYEDLKS
jgi:menaquinone-dependent protoporphyrinogen IX oxidase